MVDSRSCWNIRTGFEIESGTLSRMSSTSLTFFAALLMSMGLATGCKRTQPTKETSALQAAATGAARPADAANQVVAAQGVASPEPSPDPPLPPETIKELAISEQNAAVLNYLGRYPDLEVLSIRCLEDLKALPESLGQLARLKELRMDNGNGCAMNPKLPQSMGNLQALETLVLVGAQDPREPGSTPHVLQPFPKSMSQLRNLKHLDLGRNGMEEVPAFVQDLSNLQTLGFGWNMQVKELPRFLANLRELETLDLMSDGLADLPDFLSQLPKLKRIKLGNNCTITQDEAKKKDLQRRFPRIMLDFDDEYDCS